MLCQFTVKNFQCIREELTLDLQATGITEHPESVLEDADGERFLPLAVIYGPNGGGKSTVLRALYALACKIMKPICAVTCTNTKCAKNSDHISVEPYAFSKETAKAPTEYELFFRTASYEYQYCASILREKFISEELYRKALRPNSRYSPVFSRTGNKSVVLRGSLKNYSVTNISESISLISFFGITHGKNKLVSDIVGFFDNQIDFRNYGDPRDDARVPVVKNSDRKALILKMMAEMDLGISDYQVKKKEEKLRVYTTHRIDGADYVLPFSAESNGTIKVFGLLPYIADSIADGSTLVIDELDAKLHPMLLRYIIQLYSNPEINTKKAQLIFTSHDLTTMNRDTFRRDEIWFIAKGEDQSAHMYSLVEIKERKNASYSTNYIKGHYGADPYLKRIIRWGE